LQPVSECQVSVAAGVDFVNPQFSRNVSRIPPTPKLWRNFRPKTKDKNSFSRVARFLLGTTNQNVKK
jgi:hypothetical protein